MECRTSLGLMFLRTQLTEPHLQSVTVVNKAELNILLYPPLLNSLCFQKAS